MVLVDANILIRMFTNDNEKMAKEAADFLTSNSTLARNEVLAEVVHVLQKVYKVDKIKISDFLLALIHDKIIFVENERIVALALTVFSERNLDFVDCLLYSYNKIEDSGVFTFDKALKKLIGG